MYFFRSTINVNVPSNPWPTRLTYSPIPLVACLSGWGRPSLSPDGRRVGGCAARQSAGEEPGGGRAAEEGVHQEQGDEVMRQWW